MARRDVKLRQKSLPTISYSTSTPIQTIDIPRDGHIAALLFRLVGSLTLAGGSTSGTVISNPISPLGLVKRIAIEQSPAPTGGAKFEVPVQLLHLLWYRTMRRAPRITGLSNGDAATTAIEAKFVLPMALFQSLFKRQSLYPASRETSFTLTIEWYSTDANKFHELSFERAKRRRGAAHHIPPDDDHLGAGETSWHGMSRCVRMLSVCSISVAPA